MVDGFLVETMSGLKRVLDRYASDAEYQALIDFAIALAEVPSIHEWIAGTARLEDDGEDLRIFSESDSYDDPDSHGLLIRLDSRRGETVNIRDDVYDPALISWETPDIDFTEPDALEQMQDFFGKNFLEEDLDSLKADNLDATDYAIWSAAYEQSLAMTSDLGNQGIHANVQFYHDQGSAYSGFTLWLIKDEQKVIEANKSNLQKQKEQNARYQVWRNTYDIQQNSRLLCQSEYFQLKKHWAPTPDFDGVIESYRVYLNKKKGWKKVQAVLNSRQVKWTFQTESEARAFMDQLLPWNQNA